MKAFVELGSKGRVYAFMKVCSHYRRKELVCKEQTLFLKHFQMQNIDRRNSCFPVVNFLAFLSSEKIFVHAFVKCSAQAYPLVPGGLFVPGECKYGRQKQKVKFTSIVQ